MLQAETVKKPYFQIYWAVELIMDADSRWDVKPGLVCGEWNIKTRHLPPPIGVIFPDCVVEFLQLCPILQTVSCSVYIELCGVADQAGDDDHVDGGQDPGKDEHLSSDKTEL